MNGKRVHERFSFEFPVVITHADREIPAVTRNLSLGGLFLVTPETFAFGDPVTIRLRLPTLRQNSVLEATVRWKIGDGYGVQFGSLHALDVWGLNQLFYPKR